MLPASHNTLSRLNASNGTLATLVNETNVEESTQAKLDAFEQVGSTRSADLNRSDLNTAEQVLTPEAAAHAGVLITDHDDSVLTGGRRSSNCCTG